MTTPYVPVAPVERSKHVIVKVSDLKLGDIIRFGSQPYGKYMDCTVKQIKDGIVTLFRPYVETSDFSHTGGVTCLVGIEEFSIEHDSLTVLRIYLAPEPR